MSTHVPSSNSASVFPLFKLPTISPNIAMMLNIEEHIEVLSIDVCLIQTETGLCQKRKGTEKNSITKTRNGPSGDITSHYVERS